jgi:meso-butanediol dehydrogenase/(S,S)-butanediol dehydrogenase/diacetyl reductase
MMLEHKVALVTGAAQGIGRGIVLRLAREGALIGVLDVRMEQAECVADEVRRSGGRACALQADVSHAGQVRHAIGKLIETLGAPNILVHNAGIMPEGTIDRTAEPDWDCVFAVNVKGVSDLP